jgi:hypothetical protein
MIRSLIAIATSTRFITKDEVLIYLRKTEVQVHYLPCWVLVCHAKLCSPAAQVAGVQATSYYQLTASNCFSFVSIFVSEGGIVTEILANYVEALPALCDIIYEIPTLSLWNLAGLSGRPRWPLDCG